MTEDTAMAGRRPKGRSPSYPAIALEQAIRRARELYDNDRQHSVPVVNLARLWNYRSLNGPAAVTMAALKKFGLLEYEGSGQGRLARLTDMAVDILANPDAEEHAGAIRTAALLPPIHSELWEKYGNELPSDATLEWELTKDRGFTETGAREFIPVYRDTIAYAKLEVSTLGQPQSRGTVWSQDPASDGGDGADDESGPRRRLRMHVSAGRATYAVPLASGGLVALEGDFPISERDWQQLMAVLNAMKPGLVMEPPRQSGAGGDEDENA